MDMSAPGRPSASHRAPLRGALRLRPATPDELAALLAGTRGAALSYEPVGAPATPAGWFDNRGGILLGHGEAVFHRAKDALRAWTMFDLGWVRAVPEVGAAISPGAVVAVATRTFGISTVNVAKVLSVWDEPRRFAFSYGTTAHHVERGEETFSVTWHADGRVTYDVWSYSRAAHPLVWLVTPIARALQRRFIRESCARMARALAPDSD